MARLNAGTSAPTLGHVVANTKVSLDRTTAQRAERKIRRSSEIVADARFARSNAYRVGAVAAFLTSIIGAAAHATPIITGITLSDQQAVMGMDTGSPPSSASAINNFDGLVTLP